MIFPFTIKFSKRLKEKVSAADIDIAMTYIKKFIIKKTAEDIIIDRNELTFKSGFFRMRWSTNIMGTIEKGKFNLIEDGNESVLTYEFFMYRIFTIVAVISIFMGTISHQPWLGVICFVWLGIMNWVIAIIRHRNMLGDIATGIDNLIASRTYDNQNVNVIKQYAVDTPKDFSKVLKWKTIFFYFTLTCWSASIIANLCAIADFDVMEKFPFVWFLHIGVFIVIFAAILLLKQTPELQDQQIRSNPLKVLGTVIKGTPYWLIAIAVVGFIYSGINFSLFASSQVGTPEIKDGQFILQDHGQFIRTISKQEYHHFRANIIRGFSGHWIGFYGIGLVLLFPFKNSRYN
jgi:hypothetical protein